MTDQELIKAFFRWLKKHQGKKVKIEQFRQFWKSEEQDWQRDKYASYKTLWLVL